MPIVDGFNSPIISTLRSGTQDDPFINRKDRHVVINNYVFLQEIPDNFNLLQVTNPDATEELYYKIVNGNPQNAAQYLVDYTYGYIQFHPDANGKNLLIDYWGKGGIMWPIGRIWTLSSDNNVTQTLQDVVNVANEAMVDYVNEQERISNEDIRISAEDIRISNETTRGTNETGRVTTEGTRVSSENTRIANEIARVSAENIRISNGALIKSGDTMNGILNMNADINMNENAINLGGFKIKHNANLNSLDIEF